MKNCQPTNLKENTMSRFVLVLAMMVIAAGCTPTEPATPAAAAASGSGGAKSSTQAPTIAELAAYSASRKFPNTTQPRTDLHTAAIVQVKGGIIKIYNF